MENIGSIVLSLFNNGHKSIIILRKTLFYYNIKTVFEYSNECKENNRVILYSNSPKGKLSNNIDYSLINGLIIELTTGKVLCMPQKRLSLYSRSSLRHLNSEDIVNDYNILKLNDGTTINLYWYHVTSTWVISTTRGMNMNDMLWIGSLSYEAILHKLLLLYPNFDWDKLDKCKTYTVGFNHPNFHPFRHGCLSGRLWFIQSTHNDSLKVNRTEDIGLPLQQIYKPDKIQIIDELITLCDNSLDVYLTNSDNKEDDVCFGFILVNKITDKHLLVESLLFQTIKKIMYSGRYNEMIKDNNYERLSYIIIVSYLNPNINTDESLFLKLFPQFNCIFNQFDKKIKQITNILAMCFLAIEKNITIDKYNSNTSIHVLIRKLHTLVKDIFKKTGSPRNFTSRSAASLEIIKYIIDENLISYYYPIFSKIVEEQLEK